MLIFCLRWMVPCLLSALVVVMWVSNCQTARADNRYTEVNWEQLDLSDQQRQQLKSLDQQWQSKASECLPRLKHKMNRLKTMINSPQADEAQILELKQDILKDEAQLNIHATQLFMRKRKLLNQEQNQRLNEMMQRRKAPH